MSTRAPIARRAIRLSSKKALGSEELPLDNMNRWAAKAPCNGHVVRRTKG